MLFILRAGGDSLRAFLLDQLPSYLIGLPIAMICGINASNWHLSMIFVFAISHLNDITKIFLSTYFIKKGYWIKNLTLKEEKV